MSIKESLKELLPRRLHNKIPSSFDLIGSREKAVAIIEIPKELARYKLKIANAIMKQHKNVVTVLDKGTPRKGVFRVRDYKIISGNTNTEVVHNENNCRFIVDPCKAYFSQREGTERLRIASLVKNNETVMVFFAGVGPFPIVISKKADAQKIIGIEINPDAVAYFKKNVLANKCKNIEVVEGDAKEKASEYNNKCDRIIMPLPETAIEYLPEALQCIKKNGTIHLYFFSTDEELPGIKKKIRMISKKNGKKISFSGKTNVLPYGPGIWKMRLDITLKS